MSTQHYTQYGLEPLLDLDIEGGAEPIRFNVILEAKNDRIILRYDLPGSPGQDYIAVEQNSMIEIALIGDQLFFSKDYDAITTKEPLSSFYGGLTYEDYDSALDRYKRVTFKARYNAGGKFGTNHPFNINVDLLQNSEAEVPKWIGLSIDPDIKNPPPKPN
ncbi:nucleotide synthetase [Sphingobium sp.]|uniref:nucleotide synthetase n=1 Tax=Sphingobium sp. TaxID=1912891 RepID=UPI0026189762|nr:nucleotide synthetase [Sphingobium sp.]